MATSEMIFKNDKGETVFYREAFTYPDSWDYNDALMFAKHFAKKDENSVDASIERILSPFHGLVDEKTISDMHDLFIEQKACLNSPAMFNLGTRPDPIASACFILSVDDDMMSIADLLTNSMMIFKQGAGVGASFHKLRASMEHLSNSDGVASGPTSFMRNLDSIGNVVKSGGRLRRAAIMVINRVDHPDIYDFIRCKVNEEKKARILSDAGYGTGIESEAYRTVAFQNMNISVSATDFFMQQAITPGGMSDLTYRTTGQAHSTVVAEEILDKIAETCWECGDPGIQFYDTINRDNPFKDLGEKYQINGSNPCISGDMYVHTEDGLRKVSHLNECIVNIVKRDGSVSAARFYKTGKKKVVSVDVVGKNSTITTPDHKWLTSAGDVCAKDLSDVNNPIYSLPCIVNETKIDNDVVMIGFAFGDGTFHNTRTTNTFDIRFNKSKDTDVMNLFKTKYEFSGNILSSVSIRKAMESYGIPQEKIPTRYVPDSIKCGSPDFIASFLRGLYSANGSVLKTYKRVTLKTTCEDVARSVVLMLSVLGIPAYITSNKQTDVEFSNGTYTCKKSFDVNIGKVEHIKRFEKLVGFVNLYKMDLLKAIEQNVASKKCRIYNTSVTNLEEEVDVYDFTVLDGTEPYGIFNDGVVLHNCSEFVFLDDSACNLASINLIKFIQGDTFDTFGFNHACKTLIRIMDAIVDIAHYPTEKITNNSQHFRPLGLGFTGLGTMLMKRGIRYGSPEACDIVDAISREMSQTAWLTSHELYEEKGANLYPDEQDALSAHVVRKFGSHMPYGYRNSQVTLLAPTGTISFIMGTGNSTGIEPILALEAFKSVVGGGTIKMTCEAATEAAGLLGKASVQDALGDPETRVVFATAYGEVKVTPQEHLHMMASAQRWLSGAISKTVSMSKESTVDDIKRTIIDAWAMGIKCIALYRDGSKMSQPVNVKKADTSPKRSRMPETRTATVHHFEIMGEDGYITLGRFPDGRVGEIFVNMHKQGSTIQGLLHSWSIALSMALQYGAPFEDVIRKFRGMRFDPSGFTTNRDIEMCTSIVDYVAQFAANMDGIKTEEPKHEEIVFQPDSEPERRTCPSCGNVMVMNGRCHYCPTCGQSGGCS